MNELKCIDCRYQIDDPFDWKCTHPDAPTGWSLNDFTKNHPDWCPIYQILQKELNRK